MNVKGFLLEDDQGREYMVMCEQLHNRLGKTFSLRGWQRRRLVPLKHTDGELRQIVAGALITLNDLFETLPRFVEHPHHGFSTAAHSTTPLLGRTPTLREVGTGVEVGISTE